MAKTLRELTIKIDAETAELKKEFVKLNKKMSQFQRKMKGIGAGLKNAFSVVAIVAAGRAIVNFTGEMSTLGKELEGVQNGFKGIDPQILQDVKTATRGTVTELNLMKRLNIAKSFNLPLKEMGTLFEFVHREARRTGQSVDKLTDVLILGLGRESKLRIDDLGISVSQMNEQLKKTPDFTTAVATIMKARMAEAGEYIETAADITERWGADWENMKAEVGLFINKGIKLIAPVIDDLRKDMGAMFSEASKDIIKFVNEWITLYNESIAFRSLIVGLKTQFNIMWTSFKLAINLMIDAIKVVGKTIMFSLNPKNWGKGFAAGIAKIAKEGFGEMKADAERLGSEMGESLFDGITEVTHGKKEFWTEEMFSTEAVDNVKKKAKGVGKDIGKELKKGIQRALGLRALTIEETDRDITDFAPDVASAKGAVEEMKTVALDLSSVNNFMADSFAQLGQNIGASLTGTGNLLDGFLNIILDFAAQFGKILIGIGVAKVALEKISITGLPAIIAGVALVAGVKAIRGLMKGQGFAQGGIVGGGSFSHDRVPIMAKSGEMVLNNRQQSNMFRQINTGQQGFKNGQIVSKISGPDILFVWEEAQRQNNNSF